MSHRMKIDRLRLAVNVLKALWLVMAMMALAAWVQGCAGEQTTRVVTPTPPPTEAPDTGFFAGFTFTGNWNGTSLINARCAIAWDLKDALGNWVIVKPEWGCTAGTDEDAELELNVVRPDE